MPLYDTLKNVVWIDRTQLLVSCCPLNDWASMGSLFAELSRTVTISLTGPERATRCLRDVQLHLSALASEIAMVLAFKTERCHLLCSQTNSLTARSIKRCHSA